MDNLLTAGTRQEFRDKDGHRRFHVWVTCPECQTGRWVRDDCKRKQHYSGLCRSCCGKTHAWRSQGSLSPGWKGGKYRGSKGYIHIWLGKDDFFYRMVTKTGYVQEHRLVMARSLNRCLLPWEVVHHKNGIKDDNRLSNLQLLSSQFRHSSDTTLKSLVKILEQSNERQSKIIARLKDRVMELQHGAICQGCGKTTIKGR